MLNFNSFNINGFSGFSSLNSLFQKSSLSSERKSLLVSFCKELSIKFNDLQLLDLAFHHRSFSNENSEHKHINNERLEFLGDSVLGMATASFLYEDMMENPEGDLAKIKSNVVSEKSLAPIARRIGIDKMLVLGRGEDLAAVGIKMLYLQMLLKPLLVLCI